MRDQRHAAPPVHRAAAVRRPGRRGARLRPGAPQGPAALPDRRHRHRRPSRAAVLGRDRPGLRRRPGPARGEHRRHPAGRRRPPAGAAPGPLRRPAHQRDHGDPGGRGVRGRRPGTGRRRAGPGTVRNGGVRRGRCARWST
ncbi:hypothetical protein SGPA1_20538 [Streptomyces misionensis JCM 4497]